MRNLPTLLKRHRIVSATVFFVFALLLLALWQPDSINEYYRLTFSSPVENGSTVSFSFDRNPGYEESSHQQARIEQAGGQYALLRVDPLNKDSRSLVVTVPSDDVTISSFSSLVHRNGKTLYTASSISGREIDATSDGTTTRFTFTAAQLNSMQTRARLLSEIKLLLLAMLTVIYLLVLLRLTIFRTADGRVFAASALVGLLILAFMANVAFSKQPVTTHTPPDGDLTLINQSQQFSIEQEFTPTGAVRDVRFPVRIVGDISRTDTGHADYASVYTDPQTFVDDYDITIANTADGTVYYAGRVSPLMLPDTPASSEDPDPDPSITVPVHIERTVPSVTITLTKAESQEPSTLLFVGTLAGENAATDPGTRIDGVGDLDVASLDMQPGYQGPPFRLAIIGIIISFLVALAMNLAALRRNLSATAVNTLTTINYAGVLGYAIAQFPSYNSFVQGFPDERKHISYIAYLRAHPGLVPDFRDIKVYSDAAQPGTLDMINDTGLNYLGHPPLYYHVMNLLGGMTASGDSMQYSMLRLRVTSFSIGILALILLFYIGFTRLPKVPILHLLFGLLIISPPNLVYGMSGVNNDTMALLTFTIFLLGIIRFVERRYDFPTYLLIAVGISASLLTKLTAGIISAVGGICVLGLYLITERGFRNVLKPAFWLSSPLYAVAAAYFACIARKFHTLSPSFANLDYSDYVQSGFYTNILSRREMGVWDFLNSYLKHFFSTWHTLAGHKPILRPDYPLYSIDRVALVLVILLPLALFFAWRKDTDTRIRNKHYLECLLTGVIVAFAIQLHNAYRRFMVEGYGGGYSSRYYLCAIGVLALAVMWLVCKLVQPQPYENHLDATLVPSTQQHSPAVMSPFWALAISCFMILLVFDGFIYSVLYYSLG